MTEEENKKYEEYRDEYEMYEFVYKKMVMR